jgi:hypothetical protein
MELKLKELVQQRGTGFSHFPREECRSLKLPSSFLFLAYWQFSKERRGPSDLVFFMKQVLSLLIIYFQNPMS